MAETPSIHDRCNRLRDELWFNAREWLEGRDVRLPVDDSLVAELSLPAYRVLSTGKIQVETEDEMKKRGARSPDLADALCLTFARRIAWGRMKRPPLVYPKRRDLV